MLITPIGIFSNMVGKLADGEYYIQRRGAKLVMVKNIQHKRATPAQLKWREEFGKRSAEFAALAAAKRRETANKTSETKKRHRK